MVDSSFTQPTPNARGALLVKTTAPRLGLLINKNKTKTMNINTNLQSVAIQGEVLDEVQTCTYLDSIMNMDGGKYIDMI